MHEEMAAAKSKPQFGGKHAATSVIWRTVVEDGRSGVQVAGLSVFKVKILVMGTPF